MTRDDVSRVNEISAAIGKDRQTVARWIDEVERIRSEGGVEFRPTGRAIFADEAGSAEWQAAKTGGSKVELVRNRARQESGDRLARAKLAQNEYDLAVRSGERAPCADTRHSLRMAILDAENSVLEAQLAR